MFERESDEIYVGMWLIVLATCTRLDLQQSCSLPRTTCKANSKKETNSMKHRICQTIQVEKLEN